MRDLDKALADITAIRSQMARGTEFRGYGAATVTATAVLAVVAAVVQAFWLPDPAGDAMAYLALWVATAAISVLLIGSEMVARTRRIHSGLADEMIHAATAPRPHDSCAVHFKDWQCGHMGPGGWRRVPQSRHFWISSFPALTPSQKKS